MGAKKKKGGSGSVEERETRVGRAERHEAGLGVARVGFGCAFVVMRSEVDRGCAGGIMMGGN
jgi:hypothetical protein